MKLTRAEKLKLKYELIMDKYQDSKFARKYKHYGWDKLENLLGIKEPKEKKIVNYKEKNFSNIREKVNPRTVYNKKLQARKIKQMINKGFTPDVIKQYKRKSFKTINNNTAIFKVDGDEFEIYRPSSRKERYEAWKYWSNRKHRYMPPVLYETAKKLNRMANIKEGQRFKSQYKKGNAPKYLGDDEFVNELSKYGFTLVYYKFMEDNMTWEQVYKLISPTTQGEEANYGYVYNVRAWN
jgi:hypothetical protein